MHFVCFCQTLTQGYDYHSTAQNFHLLPIILYQQKEALCLMFSRLFIIWNHHTYLILFFTTQQNLPLCSGYLSLPNKPAWILVSLNNTLLIYGSGIQVGLGWVIILFYFVLTEVTQGSASCSGPKDPWWLCSCICGLHRADWESGLYWDYRQKCLHVASPAQQLVFLFGSHREHSRRLKQKLQDFFCLSHGWK